MKHCPVCRLSYSDRIDFCFADGAVLVSDQEGADDVPAVRVAARAPTPVFAPPAAPRTTTLPPASTNVSGAPVVTPAPDAPAPVAEVVREDEDLPEIPFAAIEVVEQASAQAAPVEVAVPPGPPEVEPSPVPAPPAPPPAPSPAPTVDAPTRVAPPPSGVAPPPSGVAPVTVAEPYDAASEADFDASPSRNSGVVVWLGAAGLLALAVTLVLFVVTPTGDEGLAERPPPPVRTATPAPDAKPADEGSEAPAPPAATPPKASPSPAAAAVAPAAAAPKEALADAAPKPQVAKPPADAPKPVATTGGLSVTSTPAGASVLIDGSERGVTPLSLTLPLGAHNVEVTLSGYVGAAKSVDVVAAGGAAAFTLQAAPFDAMVLHKEFMGATLYVDGKPQDGRVPVKVKLTPGMHVFKLVKPDGTETVVRKQVDNPDGKLAQVVLH
jgi:hypothetical protein